MVKDTMGAGLFDNLLFLGRASGTHSGAGEAQIGSNIVVPAGTCGNNDLILIKIIAQVPDGGPLDIWINDGTSTVKLTTHGIAISGAIDDWVGEGMLAEGAHANTSVAMSGQVYFSVTDIVRFGFYETFVSLQSNWITKQFTLSCYASANPSNVASFKISFFRLRGASP